MEITVERASAYIENRSCGSLCPCQYRHGDPAPQSGRTDAFLPDKNRPAPRLDTGGCLTVNSTHSHKGDRYETDLHPIWGYLIPNLVLSDTREYHIGKYGRMRRVYLKDHRPALYSILLLTEKLFPHLAEIDAACKNRLDIIETAMMRQEGVTEALKATDQMEWVRRRNSIHSRAEEIVLHELVYAK